MIGIYKIENLVNQKVYIGQSVHIEKRWQEHCQSSSDSLIGKAIKKYGKTNFSFMVLEECDKNLLNEREEFFIKQYNSIVPNGYNIEERDNGRKSYFLKYSKETFLSIIDDIKNSKLSFEEISSKYDIDLSMVYYLNRGDYHTLKDENYPLRAVQDFSKKEYKCIDCGNPITKGATRCVDCSHKLTYKCEHPTREILKDFIRTKSFVEIGKIYGVSDNSIKKWCKKYNLPFKKSEIKLINDSDWEKI